jgi:hypothetical protein
MATASGIVPTIRIVTPYAKRAGSTTCQRSSHAVRPVKFDLKS